MNERRIYWAELDVLRGLAAALMIFNHVGVVFLEPAGRGLAAGLSFLGSFAPVLFFFVTGWGYGLAHQVGRPGSLRDVLSKGALLMVLDWVLREGRSGWDFLGFIAISMLVLHPLRGRRNGVRLAWLLMILVFSVRFLVPPLIRVLGGPSGLPLVWCQVLGINAFEGISYWFTPWLIYPLAGFLVGVFCREQASQVRHYGRQLVWGLAGLGLAGTAATGVLVALGANLHRWGMMTFGYFVASLAVLLLALALVFALCAGTGAVRVRDLLSLRGISSLAVVPLHYGLIKLVNAVVFGPGPDPLYFALLVLILPLSFGLARGLAALSARLAERLEPARVANALLVGTILGLGALALGPPPALVLDQVLRFATELALCLLLDFYHALWSPRRS